MTLGLDIITVIVIIAVAVVLGVQGLIKQNERYKDEHFDNEEESKDG